MRIQQYSVGAVATVIGRTPNAVRMLIKKRVIGAVRIEGRVMIPATELDKFLARATQY